MRVDYRAVKDAVNVQHPSRLIQLIFHLVRYRSDGLVLELCKVLCRLVATEASCGDKEDILPCQAVHQ